MSRQAVEIVGSLGRRLSVCADSHVGERLCDLQTSKVTGSEYMRFDANDNRMSPVQVESNKGAQDIVQVSSEYRTIPYLLTAQGPHALTMTWHTKAQQAKVP